MKNRDSIIAVLVLMAIGAFARLIPHMPNFTPTEGLAIFGAAYFAKKYWAVLATVVMLYFSDLLINNTIARSFFTEQEGFIWFSPYMFFNLLAVVLTVIVTSNLLKKVSVVSLFGSVLISSVLFFLVSNFGAWAEGTIPYTKDFNGLMAAYTAGVPFYYPSLISTLLFTTILFGSFEIFKLLISKRQKTVQA
jgi:hypothetical protein